MSGLLLINADARHLPLADESVHMIATSPPYFGLRDYGNARQVGLEAAPDCLGWATGEDCGACFVCTIREVGREWWRVLRGDGTLWLNLGDSYGPAKSLLGVPWRVALALQADGWTLRSDIIWHKPNPMPESVTDRCTKSHEHVFMLSKGPRYYWDADAVREPHTTHPQTIGPGNAIGQLRNNRRTYESGGQTGRHPNGRNKRDVWTIATQPYPGAHFAVWPPALVEPMILAGCPEGGVVLDTFAGSGTTGRVALANRRSAVLVDCNREYLVEQATARTSNVQINMGLS